MVGRLFAQLGVPADALRRYARGGGGGGGSGGGGGGGGGKAGGVEGQQIPQLRWQSR